MKKRWGAGEVILREEFLWRVRRQLITVMPQVVVHDDHDFLAVLSQPGMTFMSRDVPGRNSLTVEERLELYMKEQLQGDWYERVSRRAVLTLYRPEVAHSVSVFWDAEWRFRMWYVNLERPYVRSARGIVVSDDTLDIVATADFAWSWKDEPEFEALTAAGKIPAERAQAIRAEGERAIERIERREWPFGEPWPDWRPPAEWPVPHIKDYWCPE